MHAPRLAQAPIAGTSTGACPNVDLSTGQTSRTLSEMPNCITDTVTPGAKDAPRKLALESGSRRKEVQKSLAGRGRRSKLQRCSSPPQRDSANPDKGGNDDDNLDVIESDVDADNTNLVANQGEESEEIDFSPDDQNDYLVSPVEPCAQEDNPVNNGNQEPQHFVATENDSNIFRVVVAMHGLVDRMVQQLGEMAEVQKQTLDVLSKRPQEPANTDSSTLLDDLFHKKNVGISKKVLFFTIPS